MAKVQSRGWSVVINNYTQEDIVKFKSLNYSYLCGEEEHIDGNGTPHLQAYIYHTSPIKFETLKNLLPNAHLEKANKGPLANVIYCSKENNGTFFEKGEKPSSVKKAEFKMKIKEIDTNEELDYDSLEICDESIKYLNAYDYFLGKKLQKESLEQLKNNELEKPEIIYYWGASGSGKTYSAKQYAINKYGVNNISEITFINGFANCDNPHAKCLIYDEFRTHQIDPATFLKLTDCYGLIINIKHGKAFIKPKCVIITSITHPKNLWRDEEINKQFIRRITKFVNMNLNPYTRQETEEELEKMKLIEESYNEALAENEELTIDNVGNQWLKRKTAAQNYELEMKKRVAL